MDLADAIKRRGNMARISKLSGLNPSVISRIARGQVANPGIKTMQKLETAIKQLQIEQGQGTPENPPVESGEAAIG